MTIEQLMKIFCLDAGVIRCNTDEGYELAGLLIKIAKLDGELTGYLVVQDSNLHGEDGKQALAVLVKKVEDEIILTKQLVTLKINDKL